jgi:predicted acyl esterase
LRGAFVCCSSSCHDLSPKILSFLPLPPSYLPLPSTSKMPVPMQVAYKPISKPEVGVNNYQGFTPGKTEVLRKGEKPHNARALESDIQIDHDVEIVVRDGCRLYVDIYRPADVPKDEKLPAVVSWSCYGKKYSALHMLPICIWNCCVPNEALSGLEKFEGLDPVVWCPRGYAIISVDSRGTGNSDGSIPVRLFFSSSCI